MNRIILAQTAGFCFGVSRAVELAQDCVRNGIHAVTLGPIIHNRHVVQALADAGVRSVERPEDVPEGAAVILRSHGVSRATVEALEARGTTIIDATCPFVKKIHRIVAAAGERKPIIIGTRTHPEVQAIAGWCDDPVVLETPEELQKWLSEAPERRTQPLLMVFQTTSTQKNSKLCAEVAKKECTNCEIFDTICGATEKRQKEALALSKQCDAMVIVGDSSSSNTKRLAAICQEHCPQVVLIDNADELNPAHFQSTPTVGITAGASTPPWIIKEVDNKMSDEIRNETVQEESFEEMLEQSFKTLNTGDKVVGVVTALTPTDVCVEMGTKHAGYIPYSELTADPTVDPQTLYKIGDEIEAYVVRVNDVEGTAVLSKKRLDAEKNWIDIEKACEEKTPVEGVVTEQNKGGVVANVMGIRVFIPASATGIPKDGDLSALIKQTVKMRITEVNRARRRVVGSIRALQAEARKAAQEKVWSEIEVGKKYKGVVKSLTSYGAFVDIGGVDGMVHISELSWNRIKNPAEVVSVGDEIEVYVISFEPEKKISLGYKTEENNPWTIFTRDFQVGDVAKVKIVKLMTFGAFAEIIPGVDGLIHISQIADRRIGKPGDVLTEGQEVDAKIIDINTEGKRISLSIRALLEPQQETAEPDVAVEVPDAEETEE